ncbi:hypothetical protein LTR33_003679 [Friedmanniomyces endolithicus]|nr:hypothetical protein LTR33_003679 [Friedmanniomyces endolithicus]
MFAESTCSPYTGRLGPVVCEVAAPYTPRCMHLLRWNSQDSDRNVKLRGASQLLPFAEGAYIVSNAEKEDEVENGHGRVGCDLASTTSFPHPRPQSTSGRTEERVGLGPSLVEDREMMDPKSFEGQELRFVPAEEGFVGISATQEQENVSEVGRNGGRIPMADTARASARPGGSGSATFCVGHMLRSVHIGRPMSKVRGPPRKTRTCLPMRVQALCSIVAKIVVERKPKRLANLVNYFTGFLYPLESPTLASHRATLIRTHT